MLENITQTMSPPEEGNTAQHRRNMDVYNAWKKKDRIARITILSSMRDDLLLRFEKLRTAKALWEAVKFQYGVTSVTRACQLGLMFDGYKMRQGHTMRQHITAMSNMISELSAAGCAKTDEEQVSALIRSLPSKSWEHMKVHLTHADDIRTFDQAAKHLELEEDRMLAEAPLTEVFAAEAGVPRRSTGFKRKRDRAQGFKGKKGANKNKIENKAGKKRPRGSRGGKDKSNVTCFNCRKTGHFACECTEQKVPQTT